MLVYFLFSNPLARIPSSFRLYSKILASDFGKLVDDLEFREIRGMA